MYAICVEWRRANYIKLNVQPLFQREKKKNRRQYEMTLTRRTRMQSLLHALHKCEHLRTCSTSVRLSFALPAILYFLLDAVGSIEFLHHFDSLPHHQFLQIYNAFFTRFFVRVICIRVVLAPAALLIFVTFQCQFFSIAISLWQKKRRARSKIACFIDSTNENCID